MDLLLHGGLGAIFGFVRLNWMIVSALIFGKELFDFLDYGLFSGIDILYGFLGVLIGRVARTFICGHTKFFKPLHG